MAKKQVRIIVGLAIAGGLLWWLSKRTRSLISYGSPSLRIHKVTLSSIEIRVKLPIINQSDVSAPVTAFLGDILYNGSSLGSLTLVNPVTLPGFGKTDLEFSLVSGLFGTAYQIVNILTNNNPLDFASINYNNVDWSKFIIKGVLKVANVPIQIETNLV